MVDYNNRDVSKHSPLPTIISLCFSLPLFVSIPLCLSVLSIQPSSKTAVGSFRVFCLISLVDYNNRDVSKHSPLPTIISLCFSLPLFVSIPLCLSVLSIQPSSKTAVGSFRVFCLISLVDYNNRDVSKHSPLPTIISLCFSLPLFVSIPLCLSVLSIQPSSKTAVGSFRVFCLKFHWLITLRDILASIVHFQPSSLSVPLSLSLSLSMSLCLFVSLYYLFSHPQRQLWVVSEFSVLSFIS